MTCLAVTAAPTATLGTTGSYVVRTAPWLITTTPRSTTVPANVTVPAAAALVLDLVDEEQVAVPGATVQVWDEREEVPTLLTQGTSDAKGRVVLRIPNGGTP